MDEKMMGDRPDEITLEMKQRIEAKLDKFAQVFENLLQKATQTSIERIQREYSAVIDKHILAKERAENLKFIGGTFKITLATSSIFALKMELYYKDANGHWVEEKNSCPMKMESLAEASRKTLEEQKELAYEIDPPAPKEPPRTMA